MNPSGILHPYKNRVLASIEADEIQRLAPFLKPEIFPRRRTLHQPGQPIQRVYFLEDGICSTVVAMESGTMIEVGIIGRDGFIGLPAVLGTSHSLNRNFIQVAGSGFSIKVSTLRERFLDPSSALHAALLRAVRAFFVQISQTAGCNRVHELEQPLARWLLMCQDRMQTEDLPITHEFLAMMLGTSRPSITVAMRPMKNAGLIEIKRGHVVIQDRKGLEDAACECHPITRNEYLRLRLLRQPVAKT